MNTSSMVCNTVWPVIELLGAVLNKLWLKGLDESLCKYTKPASMMANSLLQH